MTAASTDRDLRTIRLQSIAGDRGAKVFFDGWVTGGRWAYPWKTLEDQVISAVSTSREALGYVPQNLYLFVLDQDDDEPGMMGVAYVPDYKKKKPIRYVGLSPELLSDYTPESLRRTLLHEIVHLMRYDETRGQRAVPGHDARFCELLSAVDPLVGADPKRCELFMDDVDPQAYAASLARMAKDIRVRFFKTDRASMFYVIDDRSGEILSKKFATILAISLLAKAYAGRWHKIRVEGRSRDEDTLEKLMASLLLRASDPQKKRLLEEAMSAHYRTGRWTADGEWVPGH